MLMLNDDQRAIVQKNGTVFGRILIGLLFVLSGIFMLMSPSGSAAYFDSIGIPLAGLVVWLVIVVKVVAGGAIVFGQRVGLAAAVLIIFTVAASVLGHNSIMDPGLLKNFAVVGGLLYVMAYGKGGK